MFYIPTQHLRAANGQKMRGSWFGDRAIPEKPPSRRMVWWTASLLVGIFTALYMTMWSQRNAAMSWRWRLLNVPCIHITSLANWMPNHLSPLERRWPPQNHQWAYHPSAEIYLGNHGCRMFENFACAVAIGVRGCLSCCAIECKLLVCATCMYCSWS